MAATGTASARLTLNGSELSSEDFTNLTYLRVARSTGTVAHASLRFHDASSMGKQFTVGSELKVETIDSDNTITEVFLGEILSVGVDVAAGKSELTVGAFDLGHKLGHQTVHESFMNSSPKDVITKMAKAAGLTATVDAVLGETRDHIQQAATPQVFLSQLAQAYGCEWFVEGKKLIVAPRTKRGVVKLSAQEELRQFSARFSSAEATDQVEVRGWDPATMKSVAGTEKTKGKSTLTSSDANTNGWSYKGGGKRNAVTTTRAAATAKEAELLAAGLNAHMEAATLTGRGECDVNPKIKPGELVEIEELVPDWNGTYYVSEVEHIFGDRQPFITRFRVGGITPNTLVDLFGPTPGSAVERLANGVAVAKVTSISDPDKQQRVKVLLPHLSDDNESDWIRVVQLGAGNKRGVIMMPEVDDEVLVAFEHGQLQNPVVIGGLWNAKSPAPLATVVDGAVEHRGIVNTSGDAVVLSEGADAAKKFIEIKLGSDVAKVFVGTEKIEVIGEKIPIELKTGGGSIVISDAGDITIKGKTITLDAETDVKIKGATVGTDSKGKVDVKAGGPLSLEGATADVKASGPASIKGAMVKIN